MELKFTKTLAVVGLSAALALTGCAPGNDQGSDSNNAAEAEPTQDAPRATELLENMQAAVKEAKGVSISAVSDDDGKTRSLAIKGTTDSQNMELGIQEEGKGKATARIIGDKGYMKGDETFWKQTAGENADAVLKEIGDKWVEVPGSGLGNEEFSGGVADFLEMVTKNTTQDVPEDATVSQDEVDGQKAWKIEKFNSKDKDSIVWVADGDKAYPLKMVIAESSVAFGGKGDPTTSPSPTDSASPSPSDSPAKEEMMTATFTDWDAVEPVVAPPASEIADVSNLMKQTSRS